MFDLRASIFLLRLNIFLFISYNDIDIEGKKEMGLKPMEMPKRLTEVEGGSYDSWDASIFPFLGETNISGGQLILKPRGFALPHYADSSKIGYVLQGTEGVAAMINPESPQEKVTRLKKGDAIFVKRGAVSWWFNAGNDDLKIIFLGETYNANTPGEFTYYILAGPIGILTSFSPKIISKAYNITEEQVNKLINTQKQPLITIVTEEAKPTIPKPSKQGNLTLKFDEIEPDIGVEKGGSLTSLTSENYPVIEEGSPISGKLLKLDPNAMFGPCYNAKDSGVELSYVTKGSGWVQVVGINGQTVLDSQLEAGQLFAVPKYYVVAIVSGDQGIECFSVVTTSKPVRGEVTGKRSLWNVISPQVLQTSFDVNPELLKLIMNNINKTTIITPPN